MGGSIAPVPFPPFLTNNGVVANGYQLFIYAAGTTTKVTVYQDQGLLSAHANPIIINSSGRTTAPIFIPAGLAIKQVFTTDTDTDPPVSPIWTADNINAVNQTELDVDITGTAGSTLSQYRVVYLSDGSGGNTAGRWYLANAGDTFSSTAASALGVTQTEIASGETGTIRIVGKTPVPDASGNFGGLTPGQLRYLTTGVGGRTASSAAANARAVGIVQDATNIILSPWVRGTHHYPDAWTFTGTLGVTGLATFTTRPNVTPVSTACVVGGRFSVNTTAVGNVGAGEDNLMTQALDAALLATDGQAVRVTAWGSFAANANNKNLKGYFGATNLVGSGSQAFQGAWRAELTVVRTGAATQTASGVIWYDQDGSLQTAYVGVTAPTETLANAITVKFTGEATSNDDIVQNGMVIETLG